MKMSPASSALGAVALLGVGGAIFYSYSKKSALADAELVPVELPGLTIALPDWTVGSETEDGHWEAGVHRRLPPGGNDRFIEVRWAVSDPLTNDEFAQSISVGGLISIEDRWDIKVAGHDAHAVSLSQDSKKAVAAGWYCDVDQRQIHAMIFLDLGSGDLKELQNRIIDSVACHLEVEGGPPEMTYMAFESPEGFTETKTKTMSLYEGSDGSAYAFTTGSPGRSVHESFQKDARLREATLRTLMEDPALKLEEQPIELEDTGGSRRVLYRGGTDNAEGQLDMWVATIYCAAADKSFMGLYATERGDEAGMERGKEALSQVACPAAADRP